MPASLRFIWNATRGHRLTPWRSQYLKWRIETYTGVKAEQIGGLDVISFAWAMRWELLSFLGWTNDLHHEVANAAKRPL